MRRFFLLFLVWGSTLAAAERVLHFSQSAEDLEAITLTVGTGDVSVFGCDCNEVVAEVVLRGKRWHLGEQELEAKTTGKTLKLSLGPRPSTGAKVGENWTLKLPRFLHVSIKTGVGDLQVRGMGGNLELEVGVGDVLVEELRSDLEAESGVGDVEVEADWSLVGTMHLRTGVGSITVRTPKENLAGHGFVSHVLKEQGPGRMSVSVATGVGDITLRLREK